MHAGEKIKNRQGIFLTFCVIKLSTWIVIASLNLLLNTVGVYLKAGKIMHAIHATASSIL